MTELDPKKLEEMQREANQRTVDDVMRIYIVPEIERRQGEGRIPKPFELQKAQVVMNLDRPVEIRLNDEVKATMLAYVDEETKRNLKEGDPVPWNGIRSIGEVRLTKDDPNAGHITLFVAPGRVIGLYFDFRYNGERVAETLKAAEEFAAAAEFSMDKSHVRAFAENLFAATELTSKALLLQLPFPDILTSTSHKHIGVKLNQFGRCRENVDNAFVSLLNELVPVRNVARYLTGTLTWSAEDMKQRFAVMRSTLDNVKAQAPVQH